MSYDLLYYKKRQLVNSFSVSEKAHPARVLTCRMRFSAVSACHPRQRKFPAIKAIPHKERLATLHAICLKSE
ncbi:hypothetical protein [uncultured Ruminococcus sp.]|uniref:hypothetical protein n=1 Tax=uncultured Ruminococcus sp. TaxID=165186 RepID=UPI0025E7935F|nr:hypothetical protein [uncultured Ruminococcus sp.]